MLSNGSWLNVKVPNDGTDYLGSKIIAYTLFLGFPVIQVLSTRSGPVFVASAFVLAIIVQLRRSYQSTTGMEQILHLTAGYFRQMPLAVIFLLAFSFWMGISLFWTPELSEGSNDVVVVLISVFGAVMIGRDLRLLNNIDIYHLIRWGIVMACLLNLVDHARVASLHNLFNSRVEIYDLNRSAIHLVIMLGLLACRSPRTSIEIQLNAVCILLVAMVCFASDSQSAQLAFVFVCLTYIVLKTVPKLTWLVWLFLGTTCLIFPLLVNPIVKTIATSSWYFFVQGAASIRTAIWRGYVDLILERPIFGWGAKADRHYADLDVFKTYIEQTGYNVGLNSPHNAILEIWMNFGLIGAALISLFLVSFARVSRSNPENWLSVTLVGVAIFSSANTHSSVFQTWNFASIVMAACALIALKGSQEVR